jgi:hypothetical protein
LTNTKRRTGFLRVLDLPRVTSRPTVNAIRDMVPNLTTQFTPDRNRFQSTILGTELNFINPTTLNTGAIPKTTMATRTVTQTENDDFTPEQKKEALACIVTFDILLEELFEKIRNVSLAEFHAFQKTSLEYQAKRAEFENEKTANAKMQKELAALKEKEKIRKTRKAKKHKQEKSQVSSSSSTERDNDSRNENDKNYRNRSPP